jgi:hypothetical protein
VVVQPHHGAVKIFCGEDCQGVAEDDREFRLSFISKRSEDSLDSVGYLPGSWHRDKPLSRAYTGKIMNGAVDFDPKAYVSEDGSQPEWLAVFLEEFGRSGPEVGQTYTCVGSTLGLPE